MELIVRQSLKIKIAKLNERSEIMGQLIDELKSQKSNLEEKLKKTETKLENNQIKMAGLKEKLWKAKHMVNFLFHILFSLSYRFVVSVSALN